MSRWPKKHVNLFSLFGFSLLAWLACYLFLVRPIAGGVKGNLDYISSTRAELSKSGWPLDPERLSQLVRINRETLDGKGGQGQAVPDGVKPRAELVLSARANIFKDKILRLFENPEDFTRDITRLDYYGEYNAVEHALSQKRLHVSEESLNLGETGSPTPNIYQSVLQVWMLERVATLALDNGLQIQSSEETVAQDGGRRRAAAAIRFLPVVELRIEEGAPAYIIEFPMRLSLRGNNDSLMKFLAAMQSGDNFFPVTRLSIGAVPAVRDAADKLSVDIEFLEIEMQCSSFFRLPGAEGAAIRRPTQEIKVLPRGA